MTEPVTDWPFVESDMNAWREWAKPLSGELPPITMRERLIIALAMMMPILIVMTFIYLGNF